MSAANNHGDDAAEHGTTPVHGALDTLESQVMHARALVALAEWIEYARALTEEVCCIAEHDQAVERAMKKADVRINSASFDPHHSEGLIALLSSIDMTLMAIQEGAAEMNAAGKRGTRR